MLPKQRDRPLGIVIDALRIVDRIPDQTDRSIAIAEDPRQLHGFHLRIGHCFGQSIERCAGDIVRAQPLQPFASVALLEDCLKLCRQRFVVALAKRLLRIEFVFGEILAPDGLKKRKP